MLVPFKILNSTESKKILLVALGLGIMERGFWFGCRVSLTAWFALMSAAGVCCLAYMLIGLWYQERKKWRESSENRAMANFSHMLMIFSGVAYLCFAFIAVTAKASTALMSRFQ